MLPFMFRYLGVIGVAWIGILGAWAQDVGDASGLSCTVPQGPLGKACGERVEVIATKGSFRPESVKSMSVKTVDGKPLDRPMLLIYRGKLEMEPGKVYRLVGYQSGEFAGTPGWVGPNIPVPFMFQSFFVVVSAVEVAP